MERFWRRLAVTLLLIVGCAFGQAQGKYTRITYGSVLPTTCTGNGGLFNLISVGVPKTYQCTATNTWTLLVPSASAAAGLLGKNLVTDYGADPTGVTNASAALSNALAGMGTNGGNINIPCGTYKFTSGVIYTGSAPPALIGEGIAAQQGNGCVIFQGATNNMDILWFNPTTVPNQRGPRMEHIQFADTSSTGIHSAVRWTATNDVYFNDIGLLNIQGTDYTTGTVSVTNGSATVVGTGTTFTSQMAGGLLWVNGLPNIVLSFTDATHLTLAENYQGTTNATASFSLGYNGFGLLLDPGTNFSQYGTILNLKAQNVKHAVYALPGTSSSFGTSRLKFIGGFVNCGRVANSVAFTFGEFSDTMQWNVPVNNCAFGGLIEKGHQHKIAGEFENTGAFTVVSTCNGGVAAQSCIKGVYANGDAATNTYGNRISGAYFVQMGNAVELGSNAENALIGPNTYRSNTNKRVITGSPSCLTVYDDDLLEVCGVVK